MRIISASFVLLIAMVMIFLDAAIADGAGEPNETKTKIDILSSNRALLAHAEKDKSFEGFIKEKSQIDPEREKVLERYAERRAQANYPEGKFIVNASAYTAAADECGKSDGITASGLLVQENETIACPPQFPFGTRIKIDGMGIYVCQDRGGAIKGNHIDIYMETKSQAFAFGRRNLEAEVIL